MGAASIAFAGLQLVGSGVSAYGQYAAGKQREAIGIWNEAEGEKAARDAIKQGEAAVADTNEQIAGLIGAQRTALAAQGIQLDTGSAAAVIADTERKAAREKARIRTDAARQAWGIRAQVQSDAMQRRMDASATRFGIAGTLLGSAGQAGSTAYQISRAGG